MPIKSNPILEDGDNDTVSDNIDAEPLVPYHIVSKCIYEDISHNVLQHGLLPAYNNGEYVYECINCGECFIPPEMEDEKKLSLHEYVLVTALEEVYVNALNIDLIYAESIYRIIDRIRSNYSYDYHSDENLYESPVKYIFTNKDDFDFRINITLNQITHTDLLKNTIAKYESELLLCGFAPGGFPVGSIADMALNWMYNVKKSGKITLDNNINAVNNIFYMIMDGLPQKVVGNDIFEYTHGLGIGNTVLSIEYL